MAELMRIAALETFVLEFPFRSAFLTQGRAVRLPEIFGIEVML